MFLSILTCVLLGALSAQAEVVTTFAECKEFFYQGKEPTGMDQNAKKICQYYGTYPGPRFASLYSEYHRIPLYSAYIFNRGCSNVKDSHSMFFIEPQLSGFAEKKMSPETDFDVSQIKQHQAINRYYSYTGYDRGHLNPNSFQCGDGRVATFTLTNAAPMDACFNRIHWHNWEDNLRGMLIDELALNPLATPFLITGTVPQSNYRIPRKEESAQGEEPEYEKVTVPSHVWTALCFEHPTDTSKSFSLAYMGQNQPDSFIKVMTVPELTRRLETLYSSSSISIFEDDCSSNNQKSQEEINKLYNEVQLPSSNRLQMDSDMLNTFQTAVRFSTDSQQPGPPSKKARVTQMTIKESFNSILDFFQKAEEMKYVAETACLLTTISQGYSVYSGREKRDVAESPGAVECQLVPEKSMIEGGSGDYCSSPCLYQKEDNSYWCYYRGNRVRCSPLYSGITVTGKKCKADHLCGTYGYNYYWCNEESGSWDYCSPPLWKSKAKDGRYCRANYACAKYDESYNWCYTDDSGTKQECCTQDDCFSAVNDKTCKPDHPCGHYSESYLWCRTTDDSWNYCCNNCE